MLPSFRSLQQEFRPMFHLAVPVVLAEMGWMTMGMVDALMVGRISPEAIGAVGVGTSLFMGVCIFAMGLMLGLDTLVSHAYGAGRVDDCHRWLFHGVVLALVLSMPMVGILYWMSSALDAWGLTPSVLVLTRPYLETLAWSVVPLLLYSAFRRYLQGMGVVRPVMFALVIANVANVLCNWVLIFGKLGFPPLGVTGAAWATVLSRVIMATVLLATIVSREPNVWNSRRVEWAWFKRLLALGLPASGQVTLEVGVFAAATALAGRLPAASLAAHQIALNYAAMTFMVPLGVASAGAVRVGHAVGRGDAAGASRAGWTALLFGVSFMTMAALVFLAMPRALLRAFT